MSFKKGEILIKVHALTVHYRSVLRICIGKGGFGKYPIVLSIVIELIGLQLFPIMTFDYDIPSQIYQISL